MLIVRELEQKNLVLSIASKNPVENQAQQLISASRLVSTCKEHIVALKGVCAGAILNTPVMRNCLNLTHLVSLALIKEHVQKKIDRYCNIIDQVKTMFNRISTS